MMYGGQSYPGSPHSVPHYFIPGKGSIEVFPLSCEFNDVELGVTYEMVVTLKNCHSKGPKRVRIGSPVVDLEVGPICPFTLLKDDVGDGVVSMQYGLEKKVRVRYTCPPGQRTDSHSSFTVKVENEPAVIVALHAYPPKACLEHEISLDMGVVVVNHATAKPFSIRNTGAKPAKFKVEIDTPLQHSLSISPSEGVVSPKSELKVVVRFEAKENENQFGPVIFNDAIFIFQEDVGSIKGVDLMANIVEQSIQLLVSESDDPSDEEALRRISSGDALILDGLYFGQSRTISGALVNNGPQSSSFSVSVGLADDASEQEEKEERSERQLGLVVLNANPTEGTVEAFSRQKIQVEFTPHLLDTGGFQPGYARDYNRKITVGIVETGQTLDLVLVAKAMTPWVSLDKAEMSFADCCVGDKLTAQFRMTNHSPDMGVDFMITRVAHFKCTPMKGWLPPQETYEIEVMFHPQQLGHFRSNLEVKLAGNFTILLRLNANAKQSSGSPNTATNRKVNIEEDTKSILPKLQYSLSTPSSPEMIEVSNKRKQNNGKYVAFLRTAQVSRFSRTQKDKTADFEFGVDMGMEPGIGLESPRLVLPKIDRTSPLPAIAGLRKSVGSKLADDQGQGLSSLSLKNQFMKRRFKPTPTTQNEIRECKARLSRGDLLQSVTAGNKKIDFGVVAVGSENTRLFDFSNGLRHHVHVQLTSDHPELSGVEPVSQVVPPGATTSFDIPFSSSIPQHFFSTLTYTINYAHTYTITVTAQVVPISLELTRDDIHLLFQPNFGRPFASETVGLRNPHKQKAEFKAVSISPLHGYDPSCFSISPSEGVIEPLTTLDLEVRFHPNAKSAHHGSTTPSSKHEKEKEKPPRLKWEETIAIKVNNGPDKLLQVSGAVSPAVCAFAPRKIDMGVLAVGLIAKRVVKITNTGQNDAYFEFEPLSIPDIVVSPSVGYVAAGGAQDILITLQPQNQQVYTSLVLTAVIPGSKPIKLTVEARADFPTVIVQQEQFDFGGVYIGAAAKLPFTLNNLGTIPAMLVLDLSPYPNFSVQIPPDMEKSGDAVLVKVQKADGGALAHSASGMDSTAAAVAANDSGKTVWQLNMAPGSSWNLFLTFRPTKVEQLSFELPLGISGKPNKSSLQRTVNAMGLKPLLHITPLIADFGSQVVQKEGSKSIPVHETLILVNECDKPLHWELDISHPLVVQGIFIVQPIKGTLEAGQRAGVRTTFCPQDRVTYVASIPVHLTETGSAVKDSSKPYLEVVLKGGGIFPMLTFYPHEVILPVVPLGMRSSAYFWVINNGYDQLELNSRLPVDKELIPLQLEFPTGNNTIGPHREKVLVQVHFTAARYVSFTAKIEFLDGEGNIFSIPVSGISENCMLTVYPYLTPRVGGTGFEKYEYNSKQTEIMLVSKSSLTPGASSYAKQLERERDPFAPAVPTESFALIHAALPLPWDQLNSTSVASSGVAGLVNKGGNANSWPTLPEHASLYQPKSIAFMASWLSANMPMKAPLKEFPGDLIQSCGLVVWDMIEAVTGKKIPSNHRPPVRSPSDDKWANSSSVLQAHQSLFSFLQTQGAFLNIIRPEFLLDLEDFMRVKTPKLTAAQRAPIQGYIEKLYTSVSSDSWMYLLQQVIKIYALRPISYKSMKTLPGMQHFFLKGNINNSTVNPTKQAKRSTGSGMPLKSNIYSDSELTLLMWMSYHSARGNPAHRPLDSAGHIANLDSELRDGIVLGAVMMSHISFPQPPRLSSMYQIPTEREHLMHNGSNVVGALKEIGLEWAPHVTDIVDSCPLDLLLITLYFYNTLPMFIPHADLIFNAKMHQKLVQTIHITNPSTKPVTYSVRLDGSTYFKVSADLITIEPRADFVLPVEFCTPFSVQSEARLMLQSKRVLHSAPAPANAQRAINDNSVVISPPSILIFRLKSSVDPSVPHKKFNFTAKIYNVAELPIEIDNPLKCTGKFKLTIIQERRAPLFEAFRCQQDRMILKDSEKMVLPLFFLPLRVGQSSCRLQFYDEKAGEFAYLITVDVSPPPSLETIKLLCEEYQSADKDIVLQVTNPLLSHVKEMVNRLVDPTGKKRLRNDALAEIADFSIPPGTPLLYSINYSSPFFSGPDHITIQTNPENLKPMQSSVGTGHPRFTLKFSPKNAGIYTSTVTLVSDWDIRVYELEARAFGKSTVLRLDFVVPARQSTTQEIPIFNPDPKEWVLHSSFADCQYFSGPSSVTVPAKHHHNYPLIFRPQWMCETEGTLTLVNTVTGDRLIYQLRGKGIEPLAEGSKIDIQCVARKKTNASFHIPSSILNSTFLGGGDELKIDSDIPYVRGNTTVKVREGLELDYDLAVIVPHASNGTNYSGMVKFTSTATGQYVWFNVNITAARPPPEATLDITCLIRDKVQISIPVLCGHGSNLDFTVIIEGEGLSGSPLHVLDQEETAVYEMTYAPLAPAGKYKGTVRFINEDVGEFWFALNLTAVDPPPINLAFECELGRCHAQSITIDNPSKDTAYIEWENSNHCFRVKPIRLSPSSSIDSQKSRRYLRADDEPMDLKSSGSISTSFRSRSALANSSGSDVNKLTLLPHSSVDVDITFWPSLVGTQTANLVFKSTSVGTWNFNLKGVGLPPTTMDTIILIATIDLSSDSRELKNLRCSENLRITNVLDRDATASFRVVSDEPLSSGIFEIAVQRLPIKAGGVLTLPVSFLPPSSLYEGNNIVWREHHAAVVVKLVTGDDASPTEWIYPLCGILEVKLPPISMSTTAKNIVSRCVELGEVPPKYESAVFKNEPKPLLSNSSSAINSLNTTSTPSQTKDVRDLEFEWTFQKSEISTALEVALSATIPSPEQHSNKLALDVQFLPLKSLSSGAELIVTQKSGLGRWKIPVSLFATAGEPDDVITIRASGGRAGGVSFALRSLLPAGSPPSPFISKIIQTHPSNLSTSPFSLHPIKGQLHHDDTIFKLVFSPNPQLPAVTSYTATLVIETPEIVWQYELRGIIS